MKSGTFKASITLFTVIEHSVGESKTWPFTQSENSHSKDGRTSVNQQSSDGFGPEVWALETGHQYCVYNEDVGLPQDKISH